MQQRKQRGAIRGPAADKSISGQQRQAAKKQKQRRSQMKSEKKGRAAGAGR